VVVAACGNTRGKVGESEFDGPDGGDAAAPASTGPTLSDPGLLKPDFSTACASTRSETKSRPAYLVLMVDRSGSMKNDNKWASVSTALKSFFGDGRTAGLHASMSFFPAPEGDMCLANYKDPRIAMTALPEGDPFPFRSAIDAVEVGGQTPTVPALAGAVAYAEQQYALHGNEGRVAIVLVTDGNPDGCTGNTVPNAGDTVGDVAGRIPTYVVGIGKSLSTLDFIARRGGTGNAILIDTDPAKTSTQLVSALDTITRTAVSCEYDVPPPPEGGTLDKFAVNVVIKKGDGSDVVPPYNSQCDGHGWRYDNLDNPTKILLCPTTCTALADDRRSQVDLLFGCETQGDIVR
jgi:hypothetical protein